MAIKSCMSACVRVCARDMKVCNVVDSTGDEVLINIIETNVFEK